MGLKSTESRVKLKTIKSLIDGQLRVNLHKSTINNLIRKGAKFWGWLLSLTGMELYEIKSLKIIKKSLSQIYQDLRPSHKYSDKVTQTWYLCQV